MRIKAFKVYGLNPVIFSWFVAAMLIGLPEDQAEAQVQVSPLTKEYSSSAERTSPISYESYFGTQVKEPRHHASWLSRHKVLVITLSAVAAGTTVALAESHDAKAQGANANLRPLTLTPIGIPTQGGPVSSGPQH